MRCGILHMSCHDDALATQSNTHDLLSVRTKVSPACFVERSAAMAAGCDAFPWLHREMPTRIQII